MHPAFATPHLMGSYYPPYSQPAPNPMPGLPFHPLIPHAATASHVRTSNEKSPQDYPDIITWCQYLDTHKGRNQDGIVFMPFAAVLKNKGFIRITQLTLDYISLEDLQRWLAIEVGTAILIMQYAKADVQAINEGRLFFPH